MSGEMDASKTCSVCGETKPLAEFGRSARCAHGRGSEWGREARREGLGDEFTLPAIKRSR
jgi:hypothetical protein